MNPEWQEGLSYWEEQSFFNPKDLIVVGAGIVGLSAALAYKKAKPQADVLVVDREFFSKGASSRNAGFACFGSMTELLADEAAMGQETMLQLVDRRWQGLKQLRQLIPEEHMDYKNCGGFEVFTENQQETYQQVVQQLDRINKLLAPIVGESNTFSTFSTPSSLGLASDVKVIQNKLEGQLNPGKLMSRLIGLNRAAGVEIRRGYELIDWEETASGVSLNFTNGIVLRSNQILMATNGFTKRLFPNVALEPARNQIFITEPISGFRLNGTFHAEEGYLYFRNVENRLLIGGGRHWDKLSSVTDKYGANSSIVKQLQDFAGKVIQWQPGQSLKIAKAWSGILGVGDSKQPILERQSKGLVVAVRLGGMGVAIGAGVGAKAAGILLE